ncbi:alpha/beta hydrolase family protein [Phytomonospora endophytica]|uniref:Acetyl esterase/lipase n=1 Tax=Phytomonospora endophytica TaxID=714109 RepID=A0A841FJH9_9ACTN|nr:alpha/beta fold hydrolase [Phytomonospora endophytica]MBB6035103.1 acetyl esterase/lipase [Phytomonospora endophytica]GIG64148.1 lipase [Phytomonospora endophytica]
MSDEVLSRWAPAGETVHYGPLDEQVVEYWHGGSRGLIAFVHGGFWRAAFDRAHVRPLCNDLAARGFTVAAVEYRRASPGVPGWPATFDDLDAALAALPGELPLVVAGHSAGGHLALWAGSRTPRVAGVLALAPVADLGTAFREDLDEGAVRDFLGGSPEEHPERYAAADPMRLPVPARTVLIHGDADDEVPPAQSRAYAKATGARLVELPGAGHYAVIDPKSAEWPTVVAELESLFG